MLDDLPRHVVCVHRPISLWRSDSERPNVDRAIAAGHFPKTDGPWQRYSNRWEIVNLQVNKENK